MLQPQRIEFRTACISKRFEQLEGVIGKQVPDFEDRSIRIAISLEDLVGDGEALLDDLRGGVESHPPHFRIELREDGAVRFVT